jgi:hypothetical protein
MRRFLYYWSLKRVMTESFITALRESQQQEVEQQLEDSLGMKTQAATDLPRLSSTTVLVL